MGWRPLVVNRKKAARLGIKEDTYLSKLIKYIPAEIIAAYTALRNIWVPDSNPQGDLIPPEQMAEAIDYCAIFFFILLVITPIYTYFATLDDDDKEQPIFQSIVSILAYVAWVFALGDYFTRFDFHDPALASGVLIVMTLIIPLLERIFIGKPLPGSPSDKSDLDVFEKIDDEGTDVDDEDEWEDYEPADDPEDGEMEKYMSSDEFKDLKESEVSKQLFYDQNKPPDFDGILRGWYGKKDKPRWCPKQSKFLARGGKHNGVDIDALSGTKLLSIVDGKMVYKTGHAKLGNRIWINFKYGGDSKYKKGNYTIIYGHLKSAIGTVPRKVKAGDPVAVSGCSGNTTYCGTENCKKGKEDHVHILLWGPNPSDPTKVVKLDPVDFVKWNLKHYSDNSCIDYTC